MYSIEVGLMVIALLLTFSTAAMLAFAAGIIAFAVMVGSKRYLAVIAGIAVAGGLVVVLLFPAAMQAYITHATHTGEFSLRLGVWITALHVIAANPLFGVGLGPNAYLTRAESYRVALQTTAEAHPHNAFLEFAAMGGIPVGLTFLVLLFLITRRLLNTYHQAPGAFRPVVAAAVAACVVATSINSLASNGWTVFPMVAVVWLVIGALTSPALRASFGQTRWQLASSIATPLSGVAPTSLGGAPALEGSAT